MLAVAEDTGRSLETIANFTNSKTEITEGSIGEEEHPPKPTPSQ